VPDGTEKVPDDVNDCDTGVLFTVTANALLVVLDAASTALNTKLYVVGADTVPAVPDMTAVPPSAAVFVRLKLGGKEPDCNSNVTLPADSGSVALTENEPALVSCTLPIEPADVTNTGLASNVNAFSNVFDSTPPSVDTFTSNGSSAFNKLDLAITPVICVELFLVTLSKAKAEPPVLINVAVASAENL